MCRHLLQDSTANFGDMALGIRPSGNTSASFRRRRVQLKAEKWNGGGEATQQRYMPMVGAEVQYIGVVSAGHGVGAERGGVNERAVVGERCDIVLFAVV